MRVRYFIVHYSWRPDDAERIVATYPEHRVFVDLLGQTGGLRQIGTLAGDQTAAVDQVTRLRQDTNALAIFTDRDTAQKFVDGDPYVRAGLITPEPILVWEPLDYLPRRPTRSDPTTGEGVHRVLR